MGLSLSQTQSGAYALVLGEEKGSRRIPIIIGPVEAQAIAIHLEGLKPPRPLTHDLIKNIASAFRIALIEVMIYRLEEGIFYSELLFEMDGQELRIDSRTSDAVALAIRFHCPIYTTEEIIKRSGITFDNLTDNIQDKTIPVKKAPSPVSKHTLPELNEMLDEAILNEDYEKASVIRDEIKKKSK